MQPSSVVTSTWPIGLLVALAVSIGMADARADRRVVRSTYADLELDPIEAREDGTLALRLTIRPEPALHIYAAGGAGFLGPTLTFAPASGIETVSVDRPAPEVLEAPSTSAGARVYRGPFTLRYQVRLVRGRGASVRRIRGTFRYQACTDQVCYKPETVGLEWVRSRDDERRPGR
jgi:DsbC/DsbD-like thiol-disulfide interchange protein